MCLLSVWKPHKLPLDHQVTITRMIKFHLKWWMNSNRFVQGMPIHPPDSQIYLYTDASHFGWGANLEPMSLSFHGRWSEDQSRLHINMLEIMAIRLALIKTLKYIRHSCGMISTDNTTVVSYINKQGGTHSPDLCVQVWKILLWCLKHQIVVRIRHIPGRFNVLADKLSRIDKVVKTEWALDQSIANSIVQLSQSGSVCDSFQSQTATVCIPRSGQSRLRNRRLSPNNTDSFCPEQDSPISVQNSSDSPSLATTRLILRGPTTTCLSSSSSSFCSKLIKSGKAPTSEPSSSQTSRMGVIKQSIRDKKIFEKRCGFCLQIKTNINSESI